MLHLPQAEAPRRLASNGLNETVSQHLWLPLFNLRVSWNPQSGSVRFWPKADMTVCTAHVRFRTNAEITLDRNLWLRLKPWNEARLQNYSVSEVAGGSNLLRSLSVPLTVSTTAR